MTFRTFSLAVVFFVASVSLPLRAEAAPTAGDDPHRHVAPEASTAPATTSAPTAADDANAAAFFKEGVTARDAGQKVQAIVSFRKAHALQTSPRPGLEAGKLLVERGDLIEAQEILREAAKLPEYKESKKTRAARQEASTLADVLDARIGKLTILVKGSTDGITVRLDGDDFKKVLLGSDFRVNPRAHMVELRAGDQTVARGEVTVAEGGSAQIELEVPAPAPVEPMTPPPAPLVSPPCPLPSSRPRLRLRHRCLRAPPGCPP